MSEMLELVWTNLQSQLNILKSEVDKNRRGERAEIADSVPAYTLATAPLAAQGGLGTGTSAGYITLAWISNGRKSGETAGNGTGILAFYNTGTDSWFGVKSEVAVTT